MRKHKSIYSVIVVVVVVLVLGFFVPVYSYKGGIAHNTNICIHVINANDVPTQNYRIIPDGLSSFKAAKKKLDPLNQAYCDQLVNLRLYLW